MEIRQLRYFISVAETLSFSEAARVNYLSQSALSQQIRALEDELHTHLFARTTHNVMLTENGELLLPLARRAVMTLDDCKDRMADIANMRCGKLNIGLTSSHEAFIREAGIEFLKQNDNIETSVCYSTINDLMRRLRNHELDMVFSMMPSDVDGLDYECVLEYKLCAIMRASHPLAGKSLLNFGDLSRQRFVLPEPDVKEHNALEVFAGIDTGKLNVNVWINDMNAILNLVQQSDMITVLTPQSIIGRPHLKAVEISELSRPVKSYVFFASDTYRKHAAEELLRLYREVAVPKVKLMMSMN